MPSEANSPSRKARNAARPIDDARSSLRSADLVGVERRLGARAGSGSRRGLPANRALAMLRMALERRARGARAASVAGPEDIERGSVRRRRDVSASCPHDRCDAAARAR